MDFKMHRDGKGVNPREHMAEATMISLSSSPNLFGGFRF